MKLGRKLGHMLGGAAAVWLLGSSAAFAATDVSDVPLFLPGAVPPLNMLVMARDHTLYYEAYNDASDLNGDGTPDVGYKPWEIDYFGYFDSHKCYAYWSSSERFVPVGTTADKTCSGNWSGDFLNYLTTSRIDALRKVLYGGRRSTDSDSATVLERSYIPQDAHSWGKEYVSFANDGYDISDYSPLSAPSSGRRHLFANTTPLNGDGKPLLRILSNRSQRIWDWVSIERPVAGTEVLRSDGTRQTGLSPQDFVVRVEVCKDGLLEDNCRQYPKGNYKPTGLLQEFGEKDDMLFGLLSGSYTNNTRGGVLRKNISSISDEIDKDDGRFTSTVGIIRTIDRFRTTGFGGTYEYNSNCGWITDRPISDGECRMWGSPVAEMIYEALRYFADKGSPTSRFVSGLPGGDDQTLGLPMQDWEKPFDKHPVCSKPVNLVISGVNPSYDTDDIPGSAFSTFSGDLSGFNASSLGDSIWNVEMGGSSQHFIGQSGADDDGAPTAKTVSSFGNIRGLAPEEPTKQGGYYSASATWFGHKEDLSPADGKQKVRSYAVALASPLPRIEIPVGGSLVTLVPFAKSVWGPDGFAISPSKGRFQPTNSIVDFYIEKIGNTGPGNQDSENGGLPYGRFRINFEDVEQGADHDMDAIVFYEFKVTSAGEVEVKLTSEYAAGGIEQHMGYVISGTTADGIYLEVRDKDTGSSSAHRYFLDTPPGAGSGDCARSSPPNACKNVLGLEATRTFKPSGNPAATLLKDPLWYAAKWGGFDDGNNNDVPDVQDEWDADGDGTPDNYFLVTNALNLNEQLSNAFELILSTASSASSVATNSTRLDTETLIYQARFRSDDWTGELLAYRLLPDGTLGAVLWDSGQLLPDPDDRNIFTRYGAVPGAGGGIPFEWDELDDTQQDALDKAANGTVDGRGEDRLEWLRGDQSLEQKNTGIFRNRRVPLGDIVNSDPVFVGAQNFGYEVLPAGTPGRDSYRTFWQSKVDTDGAARQPMIYVGANDGMLHGFDAVTGAEHLAYVPSTLIPELNQLTEPDYRHRYFMDGYIAVGDAYIDRNGTDRWASVLVGTTGAGGKTVFAIDVTDPGTFDENDVMWEFTDPDLGYTIGQPVVARMADGTWAAVFGNGYGSTSEKAMLYIVRLSDGALLKKIDTGAGSGANPNGLASPTLLADGTRTIRAIYAGDLLGNLWEFDVSQTSTASWGAAYTNGGNPAPLFVARDKNGFRQPITAPVEISRHPLGGYMLFFGTGKFFETNDNIVGTNPQVQSFYGIWDRTSSPATPVSGSRDTALTRQEIVYEGPAPNTAFEVRLTTANEVDWATKRGWYIDLESPANGAEGERVVAAPILRNGRIVFPTLIPSPDPCGFGGSSWLMEMDAISGARLADSPLDITEDGDIDSDDEVVVDADEDGKDDDAAVVSGVRSREGIIRTPAVIGAGDKEYKIASGTSGSVESLRERGAFDRARGSWRQIR